MNINVLKFWMWVVVVIVCGVASGSMIIHISSNCDVDATESECHYTSMIILGIIAGYCIVSMLWFWILYLQLRDSYRRPSAPEQHPQLRDSYPQPSAPEQHPQLLDSYPQPMYE